MLFLSAMLFAQSKEAGTEREAVKQFMNNKDPMPALYQNKNVEAIKTVLNLKSMNLVAAKETILITWSITLHPN